MVITNGQIIDSVITGVTNATGKILDESSITESLILQTALQIRIKLLREKRLAGRNFSDFDIQQMPCVPLQEALYSECPWLPVGQKPIRRTITALPRPLMGKFEIVTTLNGEDYLDFIPWEDLSAYEKNNRFDFSNFPFYTLQNVNNQIHAYVGGIGKHLMGIAIKILAEDPQEVWDYKYCNTENVYMDIRDQVFPLDMDLITICTDLVIQKLARKTVQGDIIQDNTDNTIIQKTNVK